MDIERLSEGILRGQPRAIARGISLIEGGRGSEVLSRLVGGPSGSRVIGVTGPPGAGKSTLVGSMARAYRDAGLSVGILAVDPSSPFTGGAVLGDRLRISELAADPGIYIRSLATRGALGGLCRAAADAVAVLRAADRDRILVETVGVGQDEVEIARVADSVAVVLVPGLGDQIQALKAGIVEIADVFVMNKADRDGANAAVEDLQAVLALAEGPLPPIVKTVATRGAGTDELLSAVDAHFEALAAGEGLRERRRRQAEAHVREIVREAIWASVRAEERLGVDVLDAVATRRSDPYTVAHRLLERGSDAEEA